MYTPLRFMEQIESMVTVEGHPEYHAQANQKCLEAAKEWFSTDRARKFTVLALNWNNGFRKNPSWPKYKEDVTKLAYFNMQKTGVYTTDKRDFLFQQLMYLTHLEWSNNKKVYKIDTAMMGQLCEMKVPKQVPMRAVAYLPSKCFYIDYNGNCPFCDRAVGAFVLYDIYDGGIIWHISNVIDDTRVMCINTDFAVRFAEAGYGVTECEDLMFDSSGVLGFKDTFKNVVMEDGSHVSINDKRCVDFFINFCLYLYSVNNDVEYTERTRSIYKPTKTVKNKMSEVEEFGVGFRNGAKISGTKKRVKYIGVSDKPVTKRAYASNWRSAHWHHFWVNDTENPGEKKLIVKWLEGTFVKGNYDSDDVVVHKVTT